MRCGGKAVRRVDGDAGSPSAPFHDVPDRRENTTVSHSPINIESDTMQSLRPDVDANEGHRARSATSPGRTSRGGAFRPASRTFGLTGSASGAAPNDVDRRSSGASS